MVIKTPGSCSTYVMSQLDDISTEGKKRHLILAGVLAHASATKEQWRVEETCQSPSGSSEKP